MKLSTFERVSLINQYATMIRCSGPHTDINRLTKSIQILHGGYEAEYPFLSDVFSATANPGLSVNRCKEIKEILKIFITIGKPFPGFNSTSQKNELDYVRYLVQHEEQFTEFLDSDNGDYSCSDGDSLHLDYDELVNTYYKETSTIDSLENLSDTAIDNIMNSGWKTNV